MLEKCKKIEEKIYMQPADWPDSPRVLKDYQQTIINFYFYVTRRLAQLTAG